MISYITCRALQFIRRSCFPQGYISSVFYFGVLICVGVTVVSIAAYHEYTDELQINRAFKTTQHGSAWSTGEFAHTALSSIAPKRRPISCFVITMNASLPAVKLSPSLTCYPFIGSRVTDKIFGLVSPRVQANLLANTSSWGADFTNNMSVSIAFNHIQLWRRLADQTTDSDMIIFEDDILIDTRALDLYTKIHRSGVLPQRNYILKLANRHRMQWLGGSELRRVHQFRLRNQSFVLQKCVCRTRQNFFSSAAYVIDRHAARVLLQHHLPMTSHVDIFMHYIGCRFSNFFLLDTDAVHFSGRTSTHEFSADQSHRTLAAFKEQVKNLIFSSCY